MVQTFLKNDINKEYRLPFSIFKENVDFILDFYNSEKEMFCLLQGGCGSFKTDTFNYSLEYLKDNVLVFRFNCFEGSTLDDIFLSFFEDMKLYSQQRKISFTKLDTNSLSQRINTYLNHIPLPCVIVFDSFENILAKANPIEKEEIISYIKHLKASDKYKIVVISNHFDREFFDTIDCKNTITFKSFTIEQCAEYLEYSNIAFSQLELSEIFSAIEGNTLQLLLAINVLNTLKISISILLNEYKLRKISFFDYLMQKTLTFISDSAKRTLFELSVFNVGITVDYLVTNGFFSEEQISYLVEKYLLKEENSYIYLKQHVKKYFLKNITQLDKQKIHKYWLDFYNSQLPLTPNNRAIMISRNTMRSQIEYHSSFVVQKTSKEKLRADMSLMSYLNSNLTDWNIKNTNKKTANSSTKELKDSTINKEQNFEKYELTKNELSLLSAPIDLRKKTEYEKKEFLYKTIEQKEETFLKQKNKTIADIYSEAEELESTHDFDGAFTMYCSLLAMKKDESFFEYEPLILNKLAVCAKKQNKTIDAIDFYNKLTELYSVRQDIENCNETKLKIAAIYKEMYKINHARVIWENFVNKKSKVSDNILIKSYIELADIEEGLSNTDKAVEYYKKAFALVGESEFADKCYIAQAYYKYALILDDFNQTQAAMDFYQKCIRMADSETSFVAGAYVNLAQILLETGNIVKTTECYQKALFIDEKIQNYDGVYYITYKMSQIAELSAPELVKDLLLKSLNAAKKTNEHICVTNAYIELGDYYLRNNDLQKALKNYVLADKSLVKDDFYEENRKPILLRLDDLRLKLPSDIYNGIVQN